MESGDVHFLTHECISKTYANKINISSNTHMTFKSETEVWEYILTNGYWFRLKFPEIFTNLMIIVDYFDSRDMGHVPTFKKYVYIEYMLCSELLYASNKFQGKFKWNLFFTTFSIIFCCCFQWFIIRWEGNSNNMISLKIHGSTVNQ